MGEDLSDGAALLETFDKFREALLNNDVQMLAMLMAEEYVGFDPSGKRQDKSISVEAYKPGGVDLDRYDTEEVEHVVIGSVGIITGKGYIHGSFAEDEFEHDLRFLDLYVYREGRWQLYMSQVTPLAE